MLGYVVKRLVSVIPTLVSVSLVVFVIMRLLPGDVAAMILMGDGDTASAAGSDAIATLREQLGLNEPLYVQYFQWLWGLLTFDVGASLWSKQAVFEEIWRRLPVSLELAVFALTIALIVGIPAGVIAALKKKTAADYALRSFSIAGLAVPSFWLATLLILVLSMYFRWTPPLGYIAPWQNLWLNMQQMFWPALILGFANAAAISRMTRSAVLEVMREDYVRTAHAKGLSASKVVERHVLRNSMLPVVTLIGIDLGNLIGGTLVMETIFTLPGLGRYLVDSIFNRDYPVVQTLIVLVAFGVILINLITDLLYSLLDPRIRYD